MGNLIGGSPGITISFGVDRKEAIHLISDIQQDALNHSTRSYIEQEQRCREVFEEALIATSAAQIDVSKYNRGLYFIEISGGGYRTVKKLVLE